MNTVRQMTLLLFFKQKDKLELRELKWVPQLPTDRAARGRGHASYPGGALPSLTN